MAASNGWILWLDDPQAPGNKALGGKFASLGISVADGFPVPPGFGITTGAYHHFMHSNKLAGEAARIRKVAASLAHHQISRETDTLVRAIMKEPVPAALLDEMGAAYAELERRSATPNVPVAVRSSGESEDMANASFAGQYDTYLWICGTDALIANLRQCWAGMFGEAVLTYRPGADASSAVPSAGMCVGIQQMVDARVAGVMFTIDPVNGDRSKVVIEACWGLGEGVVKGDVTPSRFSVDKVTGEVGTRDVRPQSEEYRFDEAVGTVRLSPVEPARQGQCCLTDGQIAQLLALGRQVERSRKGPQDIEWAIDRDGRLWVLQVRPETVWAGKQTNAVKLDGPPIAHVLSRMSGVAAARSAKGPSS